MNIIELQQFCHFLRLVFWPSALLVPTRRAAEPIHSVRRRRRPKKISVGL